MRRNSRLALCLAIGPAAGCAHLTLDAVAASSAFPGLLSPLTLESFRAANACGYKPPPWFQNAQDREANRRSSPRRSSGNAA